MIMINGLNPIDSLFPSGSSDPASSSFGSPLNFGSVFDQAMIQAKTPADKAKLAVAQAQLSDQNALADMFSDSSSSSLGFGTTDLFGIGTPLNIPSWATDLQRLLGNNSDITQLVGMSQQASLLAQSSFNQQLSSLGTSGGGFDSLF